MFNYILLKRLSQGKNHKFWNLQKLFHKSFVWQGRVPELSKRTGIDTETLLDTLSGEDAPRLDMLRTILNAIECQLSVKPLAGANVIEAADVIQTYPHILTN